MSERFTILDLKNGDGEVTNTLICDNGKSITNKDAVAILNAHDKSMSNKNRTLQGYREREELFQRVIGGLLAYLQLRCNNDLVWDWGE